MDSDNQVEVLILGSGGSPGVPMPACGCTVCRSPYEEDRRTRCSILLRYRGHNVLIDTSTDLRQQVLREDINRIDAVLFTHTHADHVHGIDDLRPFNRHHDGPIPIYGTADSIQHLQHVFPYIFSGQVSEGYRPRLETHTLDGPASILGLEITPIPLEHGAGTATGYRIGPFAYLTDCSGIPEESWPLLDGLELLILDGLRLRPHPTHFHLARAVETGRRLGAGQTYLTHLNHEIDHFRHGRELPDGFAFAFDGQRLVFSLSNDQKKLESR